MFRLTALAIRVELSTKFVNGQGVCDGESSTRCLVQQGHRLKGNPRGLLTWDHALRLETVQSVPNQSEGSNEARLGACLQRYPSTPSSTFLHLVGEAILTEQVTKYGTSRTYIRVVIRHGSGPSLP